MRTNKGHKCYSFPHDSTQAADCCRSTDKMVSVYISELQYANCWWFVTSRGHSIKKQRQNKLCVPCSFNCSWESSSCIENHVIHPSHNNGKWCSAELWVQRRWPGSESSAASGFLTVRRSYRQMILRYIIVILTMMSPVHLFYWVNLVLFTAISMYFWLINVFLTSSSIELYYIHCLVQNLWT